ncbi:DUF3617 domain-containing protein [Sphingomonas sp. ASV193]|uniref:DUF3617 domain-containing protein n=1 Tax=Sphingomonas sp. ASV193 TaxID=3144405 RepID=UPI0032E8594D
MHRIIVAAALLASLGACKKASVDVRNASPAEVQNAVAVSGATDDIRPGKWQYRRTLLDVASPGLSPEIVDHMKKMMGAAPPTERCLTADEAKKLDAAIADAPDNCRYDHYRMAGGQLDGAMRCTNPHGSQELSFKGSYSPDSTDVTVTNRIVNAADPSGSLAMTVNMKGKRVGACDAPPVRPATPARPAK